MKGKEIMAAMIEGAQATLIIGATVGVIGIIVGTIQLTGIGLKFSQIIIDLSFGSLPAAILLVGIASLVLGMGVPVTAAYLITAVLACGRPDRHDRPELLGRQHSGNCRSPWGSSWPTTRNVSRSRPRSPGR